jgi:predicted DCC family thiol-disulfide oxidoreductase YuxK
MQPAPAIILFDGHCHLCCGSVQFILPRDPKRHFQFAPIDGTTAKELFAQWNPATVPDSIVLFENGKFYTRSTAALRVSRKLSGAWPLLYAFVIIPAPIRDWVYTLIAKNRYKWFGRSESCWMPKPEWKERFLD